MTARASLAGVRALHTAVFFVELASIGWLVLTGWTGRRDRTVAIAAGLVGAEGLVFIANSGVCPLTPLAERLGPDADRSPTSSCRTWWRGRSRSGRPPSSRSRWSSTSERPGELIG